MSTENNSDEVPVDVISEDASEPDDSPAESNSVGIDIKELSNSVETDVEELSNLLELEKHKVADHEEKLKHVLADFQNLDRKTQSDIEKGVNARVDEFALDFLKIYDDFIRAKQVFSENKINTDGLDSILKNMDSLLKKYNIVPIDALGEIFDPNYHEAISIVSDSGLDDSTIVKEIRKGYISHERVIRPTLVEISKKDDKI